MAFGTWWCTVAFYRVVIVVTAWYCFEVDLEESRNLMVGPLDGSVSKGAPGERLLSCSRKHVPATQWRGATVPWTS